MTAAAPLPAAVGPVAARVRRRRIAAWAPPAVLLLLCGLIAAVNPNFLTVGNLVRIVQAAAIPLVLGLGATFVILMGSVDLSVEGVLTLSVVTMALLLERGSGAGLAVPLVLLVGAAAGLLNGILHVRLRVPSFMTTLGTWFVALGSANALLGGMSVRIAAPPIRALAIERVFGLPWGVWLAFACLGVALLVQNRTRFGRHLYALGGGEEIAALSGIAIARVRVTAFTLAGIFYAIGGVLAAAQLGLANAQIGGGRLFTAITAVVVGGTSLSGGEGGVLQTFVGVLLVVVLANGLVLVGVPPSVQIGVQGMLIILAVSLSTDRRLARVVK